MHNPKARFGLTLAEARSISFSLPSGPPLPVVNYQLVGKPAPTLVAAGGHALPKASAIVITWAEAEWAAMQHVFCAGASTMPYSERSRGSWTGWTEYATGLPANHPSDWSYWGYYRLIQVNGKPVLLFKSNTHLDFPGTSYLEAMIKRLVQEVSPEVIISIGTAGGALPTDHIGTVRAVSAGTLYEAHQPPASWPDYKNAWRGSNTTLNNPSFGKLLFPIPTKTSDLQTLCAEFNRQYSSSFTLAELDPAGLNLGDPVPLIANQTGGSASLLTTPTFVVGTTSGNYAAYTCIEMDDAIIGEACQAAGTAFGFVRNVSDPVQNAALSGKTPGKWGSAVYDTYGFYTSYNGALAVWAMLA